MGNADMDNDHPVPYHKLGHVPLLQKTNWDNIELSEV